MGDSLAYTVQVSECKSLSWIFKCTSWQSDRILDRCQFRRGPWDHFSVCHTTDPSGLPPDVIIIQFRYLDGECHVLPVNFWVRKDAFIGSEVDDRRINLYLSRIFENMNPECTHVKSDLIREVKDVARTLAIMPRNVGREGLAFIYQVIASRGSFKVEINSLVRVKFVDDVANSDTKVCAVCLDDISKGDEVIWMPCCHIYHGECILRWLERKPTCPMCLMALPMDSC